MLLIPAIDLKNGRCVRLEQGQMESATIFSDHPLEVAERWIEKGCRRLHIVDLDGAFAGEPKNFSIISAIVKRFKNTPVQVGGGIRDLDTVKEYLEMGVAYVILGTRAIREPEFLELVATRYPGRIILGLDARDGRLSIDGWDQTLGIQAIDFLESIKGLDLAGIVYTDIARDGMLDGLNLTATLDLAMETTVPVIASGGLRDMDDLRRLHLSISRSKTKLLGAITGRAIYAGTLDYEEGQKFLDLQDDS